MHPALKVTRYNLNNDKARKELILKLIEQAILKRNLNHHKIKKE